MWGNTSSSMVAPFLEQYALTLVDKSTKQAKHSSSVCLINIILVHRFKYSLILLGRNIAKYKS